MLRKLIAALSQRWESPHVAAPADDDGLPNGDAFDRAAVVYTLGEQEGLAHLAEQDYQARVRRMERMAELRRRERAAEAELRPLLNPR